MSSNEDNNNKEDLLDITDLIRKCASECLSYSQPFIPQAKEAASVCSSAINDTNNNFVTDGTLLEGLHIQGTAINNSSNNSTTLLDLQDTMQALELGDKRMDCCEIPLVNINTSSSNDKDIKQQSKQTSTPQITYPPRIAPTSLSDGTPLCTSSSSTSPPSNSNNTTSNNPQNNTTLLLPTSPCPSLLPYWNTLQLSQNNSILPLIILQLISLEAYIGTNNGGSNSIETLYCMLWFHDGVLVDMSERLDVDTVAESANGNGGKVNEVDHIDELTVAQWVLFASSLGIVRIAEAIRWVVVNADLYEEEDFGIALHGVKEEEEDRNDSSELGGRVISNQEFDNFANDITNGTNGNKKKSKRGGTATRFCPALQVSQYCEIVWDTAISYLQKYRSSCITGADDKEKVNQTIDVLEDILHLQQSFYQAVKILSNLNDETVRDFTKIASKRSRETVSLLEKVSDSSILTELLNHGLLGIDGQLQPIDNEPQLNALLSASFDPFVNRRLLGNAPVRKAQFSQPKEMLSSLSLLVDELDWGVCSVLLHGNTLGRIIQMLENNSLRASGGVVPIQTKKDDKSKEKTEKPIGMNILSRSLIVLNLYFDDKLLGQYDFPDMIDICLLHPIIITHESLHHLMIQAQHVKQQSNAPELLLESGDWIIKMAKPLYDVLKCCCLNRHREGGFIKVMLIPAFRNLQFQATITDEKFRNDHQLDVGTTPAYTTNYVILSTIRVMERHISLGIELELYPNWYDLSTALWYRDFLLSAMINIKASIEREKKQRKEIDLQIKMEQEEEERKSKKKGKSKKNKRTRQQPSSPSSSTLEEKVTAEDFEDRLEYMCLMLHRNLNRGLVRTIAALCQAKLLKDPPASLTMFTTHEVRFAKRFEAFSDIPQPPPLSYNDYKQGSDYSSVKSKDLLASASECFRSAKGIVDWLLDVIVSDKVDNTTSAEKRSDDDLYVPIHRDEVVSLAKVCVTNSLFLLKLSSLADNDNNSESIVSLEYKANKMYCTFVFQ